MRRLVLVLLLLSASAWGQQPADRVKLDLSVEQVQMIAQTLGQLGCQTVSQMMMCNAAVELLREVKRQAAEQVK